MFWLFQNLNAANKMAPSATAQSADISPLFDGISSSAYSTALVLASENNHMRCISMTKSGCFDNQRDAPPPCGGFGVGGGSMEGIQ